MVTEITMYECDICGSQYLEESDAKVCEKDCWADGECDRIRAERDEKIV